MAYGGYHTEVALILRQAQAAGLQLTVMGGDTMTNSELVTAAGPAADNVMFTFSPDARKNPDAAPVVEKFRAAKTEPEGYVLYAYAAMQLFEQAATGQEHQVRRPREGDARRHLQDRDRRPGLRRQGRPEGARLRGLSLAGRQVRLAMRILGRQFVMGRNIHEALERARSAEKSGYRHSYDMLGESARSSADALRYFESYSAAIRAIGDAAAGRPAFEAPSISIKLSALHPRYEVAQEARVRHELLPAVKALALRAKARNIGFTIDAEEVDRLEMSLDLIEALATAPELAGWDGLGLAVQAYQKRALPIIDWLADLAHRADRRLMVRLCKGAYWDAEIKIAQERGLAGLPGVHPQGVERRLVPGLCRRLFADHRRSTRRSPRTTRTPWRPSPRSRSAPAAATNGNTSACTAWAKNSTTRSSAKTSWGRACRVYAPVGSHEDLLAYLVRRLLENGANSSFVNRIADASLPIDALIADPVEKTAALAVKRQTRIPLPRDLFGAERANSEGLDMNDKATLEDLRSSIEQSLRVSYAAAPLIDGRQRSGDSKVVHSPADQRDGVGRVIEASVADVGEAWLSRRRLSRPGKARPPARARPSSTAPPTCCRDACRNWSP
jgi:RHH-type proline utilization regulon transcriptional repressor/proline dehydrogenase/delta 1-pyrroline-5-carboxylate dehydrogenase